jgi:hypothetical protein
MKIAILLTGFVRTYEESYALLKKNILDKFDCDIFISSWNVNCNIQSLNPETFDISKVLERYSPNLINYEFSDLENYLNKKTKIKLLKREHDIFKINSRAKEHGVYHVENLRDQWYIVKKGLNLINDPKKYDIIFRLRFDIFLYKIDLLNKDFVIPKDIGGWEYSDHMAYGNWECMSKYCKIYDFIPSLYENYNIDISHAVDMLKFYMENFNKVNTFVDDAIVYNIIK